MLVGTSYIYVWTCCENRAGGEEGTEIQRGCHRGRPTHIEADATFYSSTHTPGLSARRSGEPGWLLARDPGAVVGGHPQHLQRPQGAGRRVTKQTSAIMYSLDMYPGTGKRLCCPADMTAGLVALYVPL